MRVYLLMYLLYLRMRVVYTLFTTVFTVLRLKVVYTVFTTVFTVFTYEGSISSGSRILVRGGGNLGQNFIHEFHSSHVLQWRRQNFGSGRGTFSKNGLIKDF